jgi:hypothetical protein
MLPGGSRYPRIRPVMRRQLNLTEVTGKAQGEKRE